MANLDPVYTGEQPGSIRKLLGQLLGVEEGLDRYENVYPEGTPSYDRAGDGYSGSVNPIGRRAIRYGDAPVQGTPVDPDNPLPWLNPPGRNPTDREFSPTDEEITAEEFGDVGYTGPSKFNEPQIKPQYLGGGLERISDANTRLAQENIPDDEVQDMDLTGSKLDPATLASEIADASPLPPGAIGGGNIPPEALALLGGGPPINNYVDPYGGRNPDDLPMFQGNPPITDTTVVGDTPVVGGDGPDEFPTDVSDLNIMGDASLPPGVMNQLDQTLSTPVPPPTADQIALAQGGAAPQITPTPLPMNPPPPPVGAANVQQAPPLPPSIPGGAGGPPQGASGAGPGLPNAPISNVRPPTVPLNQPPIVPPPPAGPSVRTGGPGGAAGMAGGVDAQQGGFNLMNTIMGLLPSSSPEVATNMPRFQGASIPSPQPNAIPQILQDFQSRYGPKR